MRQEATEDTGQDKHGDTKARRMTSPRGLKVTAWDVFSL
jgi:hypothetical protein